MINCKILRRGSASHGRRVDTNGRQTPRSATQKRAQETDDVSVSSKPVTDVDRKSSARARLRSSERRTSSSRESSVPTDSRESSYQESSSRESSAQSKDSSSAALFRMRKLQLEGRNAVERQPEARFAQPHPPSEPRRHHRTHSASRHRPVRSSKLPHTSGSFLLFTLMSKCCLFSY